MGCWIFEFANLGWRLLANRDGADTPTESSHSLVISWLLIAGNGTRPPCKVIQLASMAKGTGGNELQEACSWSQWSPRCLNVPMKHFMMVRVWDAGTDFSSVAFRALDAHFRQILGFHHLLSPDSKFDEAFW